MDKKLFFDIYNFTCNNKIAKALGIFLAKYSQKLFILIYVIGILYVGIWNRGDIFRFIVVPFVTLIYNSFLRKKFARPRPFVQEGISALVDHEESGSCPSNHSASAMIIAMAYLCIDIRLAVVLMVLAVATGVSRIMVGIHYPFDVLLGWIIAWIIGSIGFLI